MKPIRISNGIRSCILLSCLLPHVLGNEERDLRDVNDSLARAPEIDVCMCHDNAFTSWRDHDEQVSGMYLWSDTYHEPYRQFMLRMDSDVLMEGFGQDPIGDCGQEFESKCLAFAIMDCHLRAWYHGLAYLRELPETTKRWRTRRIRMRVDVHSVWRTTSDSAPICRATASLTLLPNQSGGLRMGEL